MVKCLFPHCNARCNSRNKLVSMPKVTDKNLTYHGNKRKSREDLEVIKKKCIGNNY